MKDRIMEHMENQEWNCIVENALDELDDEHDELKEKIRQVLWNYGSDDYNNAMANYGDMLRDEAKESEALRTFHENEEEILNEKDDMVI